MTHAARHGSRGTRRHLASAPTFVLTSGPLTMLIHAVAFWLLVKRGVEALERLAH